MKTELTPLQQLKETIYTAFPDLKKLGVRCEIIVFKKKFTVLKEDYNSVYVLDGKELNYFYKESSIITTIGKPITLSGG